MRTTPFAHQSIAYVAVSEIVDTDYGPENRVTISRVSNGLHEATMQELASTLSLVNDFKEQMDAIAAYRLRSDKFVANVMADDGFYLADSIPAYVESFVLPGWTS